MCLKNKSDEFSFPSILILFTCVILNSSNKLLKLGTSFLLALYLECQTVIACVEIRCWETTSGQRILVYCGGTNFRLFCILNITQDHSEKQAESALGNC
jgi:hypothetical protein